MTDEKDQATKHAWDLSGLPGWPRLMRRETAAAYLDVSTDRLEEMRRSRLISYVSNDIKLFDRKKIDAAFDELSGLASPHRIALPPGDTSQPSAEVDTKQATLNNRRVLFTIEEVAARWEVNYQVVARLARRRELKSFKVGRLYRITETAIQDYETRHGMPKGFAEREATETR